MPKTPPPPPLSLNVLRRKLLAKNILIMMLAGSIICKSAALGLDNKQKKHAT
jgi:hypothetical protein